MIDRPRVCFVLPSLDVGGTERQVLYLIGGLREPFDLSVVCTRRPGVWSEGLPGDVSLTALDTSSGWDPRLRGRLRKVFAAIRPDIVHSFMFGFDYPVNRAAREAGVPVVVSSRRQRATWKKLRHRMLQRRANRYVDAIVANSHAVAQYAARQEDRAAETYTVIYNGVEAPGAGPDARRELTIPPGCPVVGMVANFSPDKDHRLFVGIAERIHLKRPDCHFVLVGDGREREAVHRIVLRASLGDYFRIVTAHPDARLLYPAFDVALCTSRTEGFPNAVLEAMACGRPVVSAKVGGVGELVRDGDTGYLVASRDPEDFCGPVLRLLDDADEARRMGASARADATARFSVGTMVRAYRNLYLDLLARSGVARRG